MRALAAAFGVAGGASAIVGGIMLALSNACIGKGWTTPLQFLNTVNAKYMVAVILVQLGLLILLGAYTWSFARRCGAGCSWWYPPSRGS